MSIAPLWRAAAAYAAAINAASAGLVVADKRAAVASAWRVPEATLVAVGAAGGWPAGILAMQAVRHKTRKVSFQRRGGGGGQPAVRDPPPVPLTRSQTGG
ncbi:hypothetical protein MMPV_001548 [Pyropia vietnamensis]